MDSNLGEVICEAVDTIVSKRLEGLQYNITKFCTIIDTTNSRLGKYTVQEEALQYEAYSADTNLKVDDYVVVLIPNGDYAEQKLILHKIVKDDDFTSSSAYVSPLKQMINFTSNIIEQDYIYPDTDSNVINDKYFSLLANGENIGDSEIPSSKLLYSIPWAAYNNYERVGISADFQTWLKDFNTISGEYGLEFLFFDRNASINDQENKNATYRFTFGFNDILGDPYNFPVYFTQEKVIDISQLNNIETLQVYFYQKGNFKDDTGMHIPHQEDGAFLIDNIFVGNIKIFVGYDITEYNSDKVTLTTASNLTYSRLRDNDIKDLVLHWVHKIDDRNYEIINDINANDNIEIYWVRYHPTLSDLTNMDIVGANWIYSSEELSVNSLNPFNCSLTVSRTNALIWENMIRVKAVCRIKNNDNWAQYESNIITFTTDDVIVDEGTYEAVMGLSISCDDGYRGNYFIYGSDHNIIDESQGSGYVRKFKVQYNGYDVGTTKSGIDANDIHSIDWEITTNDEANPARTMLNFPDIGGKTGIDIKHSTGYVPELKYTIANTWYPDISNNTINCTLTLKSGEEYRATKTLLFGKANSQGSNYNLIIEFKDPNKNAVEVWTSDQNVTLGDTEPISFIGRLYDISGVVNNPTGDWEWELQYPGIFSEPTSSGNLMILNVRNGQTLSTNYSILILRYWPDGKGEGKQSITAYKPIPIKTKNSNGESRCSALAGATTITYNGAGKPSYYTGEYILYHVDAGGNRVEVPDISWSIERPQGVNSTGYPTLRTTTNGKVALSASSIYVRDDNYQTCVVAKHSNTNIVYWIQPIHITQSAYDLPIVNDWEGDTQVDDTSIKTAAVAAGYKDSEGRFSGIVLGKVDIDGDASTNEIGLYGISNNVVSFSLTDGGQATFSSGNTTAYLGVDNLLQSYSGNATRGLDGIETGKLNYFEFNLDERYFAAQGVSGDSKGLIIAAGDADYPYYLSLFDDASNKKMLNFSSTAFTLQTPDFDKQSGAKGLQIDIKNGIMKTKGSATLNIDTSNSTLKVTNSTIQLSGSNVFIGTTANSDGKIFKIGKLSVSSDGEVYYNDKKLSEYIKEQA